MSLPILQRCRLLALCAAGPLFVACGGSSSNDSLKVRNTEGSASGAALPVVNENWLVYFTSEALTGPAGEDLNGDGDILDEIAVSVKVNSQTERCLNVAARRAEIVKSNVYLLVNEAEDGRDWNGINGLADDVILHRKEGGPTTFVDTVRSDFGVFPFLEVDDKLYYAAAVPSLSGDETNIRYLREDQPTLPRPVSAQAGAGPLDARLVNEVRKLIMWTADETTTGVDLNGDGDATDPYVAIALDGTNGNASAVNLRLAVRGPLIVFDAYREDDDDWVFAFLVDEAAQGNTNLNDPALFLNPTVPLSCSGMPDTDATDQVLFTVRFKSFRQGDSQAINTGLVGGLRVQVVEDYSATLSPEADANCDLNQDGDLNDFVVRWVRSRRQPVEPPVDPANFYAAETTIPRAFGLTKLGGRFVSVISEAQNSTDLDGKPADHDLVAWINPRSENANWQFRHQSDKTRFGTAVYEDTDGDGLGNPRGGKSEPYAITSWMDDDDEFGRLVVTYLESLPGETPGFASLNINQDCNVRLKDSDLTDALPVWLDFDNNVLDFDSVGYSIDSARPALEVGSTYRAFFRVSEAEDNWDHNKDGDLGDIVLFTNPFTSCDPRFLSVASTVPGVPVYTDRVQAAAVFADEAAAGRDYNADGDELDLVVRFFEF